jgi:2-amino-4-hydroxy-6-hydroxymethyldihydropteridine diphosphokinase
MNLAVIALGSNIRPEENFRWAMAELRRLVKILAETPPQCTAPVGPAGESEFLNAAVLVQTPRQHDDLKRELLGIEEKLGRLRTADRYAPRAMDLDIVVWNGQIVDQDVYERGYLRSAVSQLCPGLRLEGT